MTDAIAEEITLDLDQAQRQKYHGQLDIIDPDVLAKPRFLFVGAGAIGSFTCSMLAKMGVKNITVIDFDTIEEHNLSNQMYPITSIGEAKVHELTKVVRTFSDEVVEPHNSRWTEAWAKDREFDVVVSCVDNMDVRKQLWDYYKTRAKYFIDGRMGAEYLKAYSINTQRPLQAKFYETTLHTAKDAAQARCTEKTIMYTVLMVSGVLAGLVKRTLLGQKRPVEVTFDCANFLSGKIVRE